MSVTILAAVARNGVIGTGGQLPWKLSADLQRVKRLTMGHVLVMGRRTYESIGRPLPGRSTVVVTRQRDWAATGVEVATSVEQALRRAAAMDDDVFVFGGADIYAQALAYADRMEITHVHASPDGDTFFPEVDWSQWQERARQTHPEFDWVTYIRTGPPAQPTG